MNRKFRELLSLAVVALCVEVGASTTTTVDGIAWTYTIVNGDEAWVGTSSFDSGPNPFTAVPETTVGALVIPEYLNGYKVVGIGADAFYNCRRLTSVTIPQGVKCIGFGAFGNCIDMTSVTIPSSVTSIGKYAFSDCIRLTSVAIPEGVTDVGDCTFQNCTKLTSVTIPSSVSSIGECAFKGCAGLGDGVVIVDGCVIVVNGKCPAQVELPEGTRIIGGGVFEACYGLTSITIPSSVTSIGKYAFEGCSGLGMGVVIVDGCVLTVNLPLYGKCPAHVELPEGTRLIAGAAFQGCSDLQTVTIPSSVTSIGDVAFSGCSGLTSVTIPSGVTSVGYCVFAACSGLTSVRMPSSVICIGESAFIGCDGLTSVEIPSSVLSIGDRAFNGCSGLMSVTIPSSVTSIGESAFLSCSGLTSVTIPSSVAIIEEDAFGDCSKLRTVYVDVGDVDRVKTLFQRTGFNASEVEFVPVGKHRVVFCETPKSWIAEMPAVEEREMVEGMALGSLPTASMDGYAFDGWWVIDEDWKGGKWSDAYKSQVDADTIVTEDMVICGKWIANTYFINFDANGGSVSPDQIGVTYEDVISDLPTPVWTEHLFRGWYTADGKRFPSEVLEGDVEEGYYYSIPSNLTVRAGWEAVETPLPQYGPWGEAEAVKNPDKLGPTFLTDLAVEIDGEPAAEGDVVAVFRSDTGALCGLGKVMDDSGTLTVVCYAPKGVTLSFKVWLAESGVEEPVVVKCDNASKLVAPESGAFYAGHTISGSTAELIETIVPGEEVTIDTGYNGYAASGLPKGLSYSKTTGKITGSASKPTAAEGAVVKFTKKGFETEELTIVVTAIPKVTVRMEGVNSPGDTDGCKVTGAGAYLVGKKVTLKATVPKGTVFMGWSDDEGVVATQATYSFTMDKEDIALVAKFKKEVMSVGCETLSSKESFPAGVLGAEGGIELDISTESGVKSVKVDKLPSGMKYDTKTGLITGAPTKAGDNKVIITVTAKSGAVAKKEIEVKVAAMPMAATGTFTGFVNDVTDNLGTFTLTTTDAGKLTAKVITAAGTVSFSGTYWDSVEDGVYRATLTTKKGETLTLVLDSTAAWDANQLSGEFTTAAIAETKKTAAVPSRTYTVSAQRNAFGKTWYFAADGNEVAGWTFAYAENAKSAALTVTLKADGSTSIAGKLPNGTDTKGKAVAIKVSASGYANVGGLKDGAILADFAPILTVNKVKTVLAIKTNLWFDRKNDHGSGVGEARFVR